MLHCDARAFACRSQAGCAADEAKQVRRDAKLLSNHGFAALAWPCRATAKPAVQTPLITGVQPQLLFAVRVDPHPCISMLTLGQQCGKQSPGQAWLNLAAGVKLTLCNARLMCRDCHSMLRNKQQLLLGDLNLC